VIRNVVIHASNEQPLLCDLYGVPTPGDVGLVCTNLRTFDGKRPIFIDTITATFFFPYHGIRFLEIPPGELARHVDEGGSMPAAASGALSLEPGEERRLGEERLGEERLPVVVGGPDDGAAPDEIDDLEIDLEVDEDFLQRVRDA
jgi:hypothetical protein